MDIEEARQQLGQRIRRLRKEQKLTIRGFALMVDLSKDYIVDLEYGRKSASFDTILKIASGFGITPAELVRGIDLADDSSFEEIEKKPEPPKGLQKGYVRYHSSRY